MKNKFSIGFEKLNRSVVVFVLIFALLCPSAYAQSMYIAEDNFRNISSLAVSPVSSWDLDRSGGDVIYSATQGLILNDTSRAAPMVLSRDVNEYTGGIVTFEGVFHLSYKVEGFTFQIGDKTENVAKIVTGPTDLRLYTGDKDGYTSLCGYKAGVFPSGKFGVKLTFDVTAGTVSVWVDGTQCAGDVPIGSGKKLNRIIISTPKRYTATAYVCAVRAYGGYSLNERFLTSGISGCPDTWSVSGSAQLAENDGANAPDVYSLSVDGTDGTSVVSTDFSPVNSADAIYRNGFLITTSEKTTFAWSTATGEVFSVVADNGNLYVGNKSIGTYKNNIWYDIQLNVNKETKAATVMINGGDTGEKLVLDSSRICSFSAVAQGGEVLIDDILAYEKNVYDVPEITKADSTDADVGMLRCDIWREGSHLGWDAVLPFANEREPYMGYYDDGNTLVSDWETKWLVEHGIDWQLNCWFIPRPYDGGAIKTPNNAYAIEEGYMRSEYSDMLDFAIMWENSTCTNVDEDIFRNNIVPYWTEHYIKDSRYKKVDGKPFVSIYNPSVFLENIGGGDVARAKENIDYLRAEIKKLGFKDAVIMCADKGLSDVSRIKEMGFDGIHAYNWGDRTDNPATQQGYFEKASANCKTADIAFVPTVSGGMEETPWGRPAGKRASPDTVKSVLQYAKDNEYYNNSQYTGGDNLVILDSWNEIAEGHYLQPTAQDGFGYLDAIRQVTCGGGEHTDDVPDEASKDIMGTLYPKNRKPNPAGQVYVPVGSIVEKQWIGEELSDFEKAHDISDYGMSDGIINGKSNDIDPSIVNYDIDIPVSDINYLKIKIKRFCTDSLVKVYYVTDSMSSDDFSEKNSVYANANISGQWETVYVCLSGAEDFSGNLKKLRIDPINSVGSFEIEEIALLKNAASEIPSLFVDGVSKDDLMEIPLQIVDGNVYMDYFSVRNVFDIKTSYIAAESKIAMVDDYYTFDFTSEGILYRNGIQLGTYAPLKTAGSTYILPVEAVGEALGYDVSFNEESGNVSLTSKRFYPDEEYNISSDLDGNGLWKYRNLACDPECTDASKFWNHSSKYTHDTAMVTVSNEVSHSGTSSVYKDFTNKNQRMGFPADIYANDMLHFSAWMKNESTADEGSYMGLAGEYAVYQNDTKVAGNGGYLLSDGSYFGLSTDWQYINSDVEVKIFTLNGSTVPFGDTYELGGTKAFFITQTAAQTKRVYMDDITLRRIPDFYVYTKSVSHDGDRVGTQPIVFTFSCDIDPWTVTADKVMINGVPCSEWGASVETVTDETTRETQVMIYIANAEDNQQLSITMPYIKDAWGRAIRGATDTTAIFSIPSLFVDGVSKDDLMEIPLQIVDGNVYMDCSSVQKVFGIETSYIAAESKIAMVDDYYTFDFTSEGILYRNGIQLGTYAPLKTAGSTYILPVEAVGEALGYDVSFNEESGNVSLTSKRFYPDEEYNISSDLDENGLWKYRNLAPDPECTDASKFWNHSSKYTHDTAMVTVSNEVSHSGTSSVYKDFTNKYQRMGFPADIYANDMLHFSAWMKNESTADEGSYMGLAGEYAVYQNDTEVAGNGGYFLSGDSFFGLSTDWQYINSDVEVKNFTLNGSTVPLGDTYELGGTKAFYITQTVAQTKRVYMDDITLRRIPDFYVYTKSVSHDGDRVGTQPIVFTFSCDIDPWTATADKVMINGVPCSEWGASVETVTDETTRETQVMIYIANAEDNQQLSITMPYIKDAWGRAIRGATDLYTTGGGEGGEMSGTKDVAVGVPSSVQYIGTVTEVEGGIFGNDSADIKKVTDDDKYLNWYFAHQYSGTSAGMNYIVYETDFAPTADVSSMFFAANQHGHLSDSITVGSELTANQWHKIVMVYDVANDLSDLYVNGKLVFEDYKGCYTSKLEAATDDKPFEFRMVVKGTSNAVSYLDDYKIYESAMYPEIAAPVSLADGYNADVSGFVDNVAHKLSVKNGANADISISGADVTIFNSNYEAVDSADTLAAGDIVVIKKNGNYAYYTVALLEDNDIVVLGETYDAATGVMTPGTITAYGIAKNGGVLAVAQYGEDGVLIKLVMSQPAQEGIASVDFEAEDMDNTKIKVFLMESIASIKPLCRAEQISVTRTYNILMIGNSFSMDVTCYMEEIAEAAGKKLNVAVLNKGGSAVEYHYTNREMPIESSDIYFCLNDKGQGYSNLKTVLENYDWDYVIIQNWSSSTSFYENTDENYNANWAVITDLAGYIHEKEPNAELMLHETWSFEAGFNGFKDVSIRDEIGAEIRKLYDRCAQEAAAAIGYSKPLRKISSLDAFEAARAYTNADGVQLFETTYYKEGHLFSGYENRATVPVGDGTGLLSPEDAAAGKVSLHRDGYHASAAARYLIALNAVETMTGKSVYGNTYRPGEIALDSSAYYGGNEVTDLDNAEVGVIMQKYDPLSEDVVATLQTIVENMER